MSKYCPVPESLLQRHVCHWHAKIGHLPGVQGLNGGGVGLQAQDGDWNDIGVRTQMQYQGLPSQAAELFQATFTAALQHIQQY